MTPHRKVLLEARKTYSKCNKKIEEVISKIELNENLSEQIVGIGAAIEWIRRSAEMDDIHYIGKNFNKSVRKQSFLELLRFNFSWFGLNAIFTRPCLLSLLGTPPFNGEYGQFRVLYDSAMPVSSPIRLVQLHDLLNSPTSPRLAIMPSGSSVSTLSAIRMKYLPKNMHGRTAEAIEAAVKAGNANSLDMPTLLYSFRNWSVHGNALDGCFGSRPRFVNYVCLLEETLAEVHLHTAQKLYDLL
jgi:hypothetical protein